jgi:ABC-type lipoprotein export system ATPase subunit
VGPSAEAAVAAPPGEPIVRLRGLEKAYGRGAAATAVLRGIDLDVAAGEIVALVGQSGSGKSTLLNVVGGLDRADRGEVRVLGVDYGRADDAVLSRLRNREIGFVFQAFNLLDHRSCLDNVILPASFAVGGGDAAARGRAALAEVGLEALADRSPGELSGGPKQRVAIARAMFNRPRLLLCDEPTGNLDRETGREIIDAFVAINRDHGTTLVIVTHEERVSRAAGRVVRIVDGAIEADGAPVGEGGSP